MSVLECGTLSVPCMIFLLISLIVPLALWAFLPWVLRRITGRVIRRSWLLVLACVLFFVSWYIPSPLIAGQQTQFMTHFIGGGVFCAVLWGYIRQALPWRLAWWMDGIAVFTLVSTLGVVNELFEWGLVAAKIVGLKLTDTSWDLAANTLGAALGWLILLPLKYRNGETAEKRGK